MGIEGMSEDNAKDRLLFKITKEPGMVDELIQIANWKDTVVDFDNERVRELCSVCAEYVLSELRRYNEQFESQEEKDQT